METAARIAVVDDEPSIREVLRIGLSHHGYQVECFADAESALEALERFSPHAVVLDVMLPGMDGLEFLSRVRQSSDVYVLLLTARDALADRVQGLESGADDYLVKPFEFEELLARLRAGLRRLSPAEDGVYQFQDVVLDDRRHRVYRDGRPVTLTAKEFELLRYFLKNPGQVLSKNQILNQVWGYDFVGDDNLVEVHISSLREKLYDRDKSLIQTIRGFGYRLGS